MIFKKTFSILTYNTWLIAMRYLNIPLAKDLDKRMRQLPEQLARTGADILCLQEVWLEDSQQFMRDHLAAHGYKYCVSVEMTERFYWGRPQLAGNGLMILSKFPMKYDGHMRFSNFTRADEAFVGKGALRTTVEINSELSIEVVTAHLGAVTFSPRRNLFDTKQITVRQKQARELVNFIQGGSSKHVILGLDMNAHYFDNDEDQRQGKLTEEYTALTEKIGFSDSYVSYHGFKDPPGYTLCQSNQYYAKGFFTGAPSQVVDYLLISKQGPFKVSDSQVLFTGDQRFPILSDHFAVMTEFHY